MKNKLWTKDFTIITVGSIISLLGNSMAGFAMSLFVLDYTESALYYAIYIFVYTLPQIAAPVIAGPLMDRFSRRKTIYLLDFTSASLYAVLGVLISMGWFNFAVFAAITFLIGTIHSVYSVAFSSFYPMLISEGNFSKAYSVSSTMETMTFIMIPIATFLYKSVGMLPLMLANSACFLVAAVFEMRISDVEKARGMVQEKTYSSKRYIEDTKDGFRYLLSEKGLLLVAIYFAFSAFSSGASQVITLPWFRDTFADGEYVYLSVWGLMVAGRALGGLLHYKLKLPTEKKFAIAFIVYVTISVLEGSYLYLPVHLMRVFCFLIGILGVTSYNIRVSATQSYVPDERKGRFNGTFLMLSTAGALVGELMAGALTAVLPMRTVMAVFMGICVVAAIVIIGRGRNHIKPIYNRQQ